MSGTGMARLGTPRSQETSTTTASPIGQFSGKGNGSSGYNMDGSVNARPKFGMAGDVPLVWNL